MPAGAGWVACRRQPEGRIETFGEGRDRLPQGSSEGGAGRGDPANQLSGATRQQYSLGWATEAQRSNDYLKQPAG